MARSLRAALAMLVVLASAPARAGDDGGGRLFPYLHCPHSQYNYLGYWAPWLWRLDAYCHPRPYIYPPSSCPAPGYVVRQYPCPGVNPAARPYYPNLGTPEPAAVPPQFGAPY